MRASNPAPPACSLAQWALVPGPVYARKWRHAVAVVAGSAGTLPLWPSRQSLRVLVVPQSTGSSESFCGEVGWFLRRTTTRVGVSLALGAGCPCCGSDQPQGTGRAGAGVAGLTSHGLQACSHIVQLQDQRQAPGCCWVQVPTSPQYLNVSQLSWAPLAGLPTCQDNGTAVDDPSLIVTSVSPAPTPMSSPPPSMSPPPASPGGYDDYGDYSISGD